LQLNKQNKLSSIFSEKELNLKGNFKIYIDFDYCVITLFYF